MQKQIQDIEKEIFHEIDRLNKENLHLKQQIEQLSKRRVIDDVNLNRRGVRIEENFLNQQNIINCLNSTKNELMNTKNNCFSILNLDCKRMENVNSKFNQIRNYIEMNEAQSNANSSIDENEMIVETKEHFEILRKMYQEATHKLMIFRNLIKERDKAVNMNSSRSNTTTTNSYKRKPIYNNNNIEVSLDANIENHANDVTEIHMHHAKILYPDVVVNTSNQHELETSGTNNSNENSVETIIENCCYKE